MAISDMITSINTCLTNIANAIRAKTGSQSTIPFASLPSAVNDVYDKATDDFWEMVQRGGARTDYEYGFRYWNGEYLRPKYKVMPTSRSIYTFANNTKLKKLESQYFDFSNVSSSNISDIYETYGNYYTFASCSNLEEIEDIGLKAGFYTWTFAFCSKLHTVAKFRVNAATKFSSVFYPCYELQNLTVDGTIGQSGLSLQYSTKLTKASIQSVLDHMSTSVSNKTITFSRTAVNNAYTDAEWSTATASLVAGGWTISLV